jgi:xylulokinase
MSQKFLIGIDVGTTSLKTILVNSEGKIINQASQEYPTSYPYPDWAQQNPEDWWKAACMTLKKVIINSHIDPHDVACVGVSSQAPTMLALNKQGRLLYPAIIWMDRRSKIQCEWLWNHIGEDRICGTNGGRIDPYYLAPKLLWFKENEPDLYRQTHIVLQANGYVVYKLCGSYCMDISHGPLTLFFDSRHLSWSDQLVDSMELDWAKLPKIVQCTCIVGEVNLEASNATGLVPNTPVVAGAVDGTAAGLEAGLVNSGDAVEMTGQSTVLLICSNQPYLGKELIPLVHAVSGKYLVVGASVASGGALRWFRDQLSDTECRAAEILSLDPFDLLSLEASNSPPGANRLLFLPYMFGERSPIWDPDARGVFLGLSLATKKADLVRAIMEGAAFGLRHNVEIALKAGFPISGLSCVGGGARSALWNQIKADVLNKQIWLPQVATGAPMGDAILAAVGAGIYPSVEEAVKRVVRIGHQYQPREEFRILYDTLYNIYVNLYPAIKASFKRLAALSDD